MAGPYTANSMLIQVTPAGGEAVTLGVVTALDINLSKEGGTVVHVYGSETGHIVTAGNRATFKIQRWFMSDTDTDLLYDIFNDKTMFTLSGGITGVSNSTISISGCRANSWRPVFGDANAIVAEEISGEGTGWTGTNIQ